MPAFLTVDRERTRVFFELYHELIHHCADGAQKRMWRTDEGQRLVAAARSYFGYARTTVDMDIMNTLLRHYRASAGGVINTDPA